MKLILPLLALSCIAGAQHIDFRNSALLSATEDVIQTNIFMDRGYREIWNPIVRSSVNHRDHLVFTALSGASIWGLDYLLSRTHNASLRQSGYALWWILESWAIVKNRKPAGFGIPLVSVRF